MASILLKNGTALIHGEDDKIKVSKTDILIQGNKIAKIGNDISIESTTEIIDCTDKIISPGMIDTHHHLWQTQLKGRFADELLLDYYTSGNWQSSNYTDEDFFWGQLGGCQEAIWAGTTTVVDHAHLNYTPDSSKLAISATVSSGIRAVFCYCPTLRLKKWNPVELDFNLLAPWVMETFQTLGEAAPFGDGRVTLGLAFDLYFLGQEVVTSLFEKAKSLGVKTITSHWCFNPSVSKQSLPQMLEDYGLLDDHILIGHANGATARDAALMTKRNAHFSSTPSTELQMALGTPVCFRDDMQKQGSLGIDCHANQLGSIISEMRLGLQSARGDYNAEFLDQWKVPLKVNKTVEEAFNLGTIQGARAIKMETEIGSLQEGKRADLIIFDSTSPGMVCAAEHDPIAAVVLHSSPGDIEAVMVDGVWRKRDGKLLPVRVEVETQGLIGKDELAWSDVVQKLRETRKTIQEKFEKCDRDQARIQLFQTFHIDPEDVVASL